MLGAAILSYMYSEVIVQGVQWTFESSVASEAIGAITAYTATIGLFLALLGMEEAYANS